MCTGVVSNGWLRRIRLASAEEACALQAGSDHIGEVSRYYDNIPVLSLHGKALLGQADKAILSSICYFLFLCKRAS